MPAARLRISIPTPRFAALCLALLLTFVATARAVIYTYNFFSADQTATTVSSSINATTIQSGDYRFTYSVDGYWSPYQGGPPTGRFFSVTWPTGIQAQSITTGPLLGTGANITIKRADGKKFDLKSFTGKILLNTAGAGAAFEIMPLINGEDAFANPLQYDCTGYGGQSFSYIPNLTNYDTYKIHMWGDFALTALTLQDTNPPISTNYTVATSVTPAGSGTASGGGTYALGANCTLTATPNAGWAFKEWTENGTPVSTASSYTFGVTGNRTLVANFVHLYTVALSASPPAAASALTGAGTYLDGDSVTVTATPANGFVFTGWTDSGSATVLSIDPSYTFPIASNRTLVANFAVNTPPIATGNIFYQLTGQPLTISIYDLIALDYDPDGGAVSFVSAGPATAHGRALAVDTNTMQIVVPANTAADSFTYTIQDDAGATATGTATISIIAKVAAQTGGLDMSSTPGAATVSFTGVPWYTYTVQRSTDLNFSGPNVQSWTVQAWADGTIAILDTFADLGAEPAKAFYRMTYP